MTIHKKGSKDETGNFQQVSSSVVCKLLESIVKEQMVNILLPFSLAIHIFIFFSYLPLSTSSV